MAVSKIDFKNACPLFLKPDLENYLDKVDDLEFLKARIKSFIATGVRVLYLFRKKNEESEDRLKKLVSFLQSSGLQITVVSLDLIIGEDFPYYKRIVLSIRKNLKKHPCLILYPEHFREEAESFFPVLFLLPIVQAQEAIQFAYGKNSYTDSFGKVFRYADYLHGTKEYKVEFREQFPHSIDDRKKYKEGRFSLRRKLLSITSLIIIISVSSLIFFASGLFRQTLSRMVQDYNLSLAGITRDRIKKDLGVMKESLLRQFDQPLDKKSSDTFRQSFPFILSAGEVQFTGKRNVGKSRIYNEFGRQGGISFQTWEKIHNELLPLLALSLSGTDIVKSVYGKFSVPVGVIAFKKPGTSDHFIYGYFYSEALLEEYSNQVHSGLFELFITDREGVLVGSAGVYFPENVFDVSEIPIVHQMLSTPLDNGSRVFEYRGVEYLGSFRTLPDTGLGIVSYIPSDRAFEVVSRIRRKNLYIFGIVLSASFILIYFFSKSITIPIIRLAEAARKIEGGDFSFSMERATRDEVGDLTESFNSMIDGLREREKIKYEFGKFVNPMIAEKALRGEMKLGGEKKVCTVLFSDIREFTSFSESREPEEVVDFLNQYFTMMVDCIHATGGVVDKFIGDAIMAHWGAIVPGENDIKNSVLSALRMRKELEKLNHAYKIIGKKPVRFGCGINTGSVIAGQIGSEKRLEYTVIGDAVNFASRIEYMNKEFRTDILISEVTADSIRQDFHLAEMPAVKIRGKEKMQRLYAVLGVKGDPDSFRDVKELEEYLKYDFPGDADG